MADKASDEKLKELQTLGGTAIKPVGWDRTGWEAFRYMLWNPDTGEVLTRTPLSWFKITAFYCVYYSFLAAFWIGCMNIFFTTLPDPVDGPKWTQEGSLIGINPGVGLRPRNSDARIDSQMFVLRAGDTNANPSHMEGEGDLNADYAARMKKFLEMYDETSMGSNSERAYTQFDISELGPCGDFPYGYVGETVAPCIFVKLNTIWGWVPEPVDCGDDDEHDQCPFSLTNHIQHTAYGDQNVWIDCNGRYAADREALEGNLEYFPASRAIPISYFPFEGKSKGQAYHSPLVAIKVNMKPESQGQLVHIECRAYYKGVKHVTKTKEGLVQFEVQIKKDT